MTNYVQANSFTAKDELPVGAVAKKILGEEWDEEFALIVTAIASKYDSTDLADQATAEAGASNAVLNTPLRTAQELAALKCGRLAAIHDSYVTKARLGTDTTLILGASDASIFTISVPSAGLFTYSLYLPFATGATFRVRPDFSSPLTYDIYAHFCGVPAGGSVGGLNTGASASNSDNGIDSITSSSPHVIYVVGALYVSAAGTLDIRISADLNGDPTNPILSKNAYVALRKLA